MGSPYIEAPSVVLYPESYAPQGTLRYASSTSLPPIYYFSALHFNTRQQPHTDTLQLAIPQLQGAMNMSWDNGPSLRISEKASEKSWTLNVRFSPGLPEYQLWPSLMKKAPKELLSKY